MRAFTPEISWHNRLPALALDIAPSNPDSRLQPSQYRIATGGNDCRVYIWLVDASSNAHDPDIRIVAGLRRHQKSVGAVRFSSQHVLASGDDDGYIFLWKHKNDSDAQSGGLESNSFLNDDGFEDLEQWQQQRVLRGHIEDICDLAWAKDGLLLLSGSVDNSAILWDTAKGTKVWCSDLIKGYVQGVALDPHQQFMTAICSDRTLRIFNFSDKRLLNATRRMNIKEKYDALFCDDTVQTFCRRLSFSPDGQFLLTPTSLIIEREVKEPLPAPPINSQLPDEQEAEQEKPVTIATKVPVRPQNVFLVFKRTSFNKPLHYYPTGREVALCVRFSPLVYKLITHTPADGTTEPEVRENFWNIPYRLIFAVATLRSIIIYDSQHANPIGYVSQIHLARLTDLAWSDDGRFLMVSSYDGYCSLLNFDAQELGEPYDGPLLEPQAAEEKKAAKRDSKHHEPPAKFTEVKVDEDVMVVNELKPRKETASILKYLVKKAV